MNMKFKNHHLCCPQRMHLWSPQEDQMTRKWRGWISLSSIGSNSAWKLAIVQRSRCPRPPRWTTRWPLTMKSPSGKDQHNLMSTKLRSLSGRRMGTCSDICLRLPFWWIVMNTGRFGCVGTMETSTLGRIVSMKTPSAAWLTQWSGQWGHCS